MRRFLLSTSILHLLAGLTLLPAQTVAPSIPLLNFCVGARPSGDNPQLRDFYDQNCPAVLAAAASVGNTSAAAAAQATQLTLATQQQALQTSALQQQAAEIQNLKALLPAGITVPAAKDVSLAPLAHLSKSRQVGLLHQASAQVGETLSSRLSARSNILLVTADQLSRLTNSTVSPEIVSAELLALNERVTKTRALCPAEAPKERRPYAIGEYFKSVPLVGVPLVAEAFVGSAQRIASLFQTNLVGAAAADFSSSTETLLWEGVIAGWKSEKHRLRVALPLVASTNPILVKYTALRDDLIALASAAAQAQEKTPCRVEGNALVDAVAKRLEALNAPQGQALGVLPAAVQRAALDDQPNPIDYLLLIVAEHTGGAFSSTKTAFSSAEYASTETVAVSYRVQDKAGRAFDAGLVQLGGRPRYYDKHLAEAED